MLNQTLLPGLGKLAQFAREVGFGQSLAASRDSIDSIFMKLDRPPLKGRVDGITLYGYLRHRSYLDGLSNDAYEPFTRYLYEQALKPSITVVDGGAHIGLFSLLAGRRIAADCQIFAFEPDPYNFQALVFNIRNSRLKNVVPNLKALSDSVAKGFFYINSGTISSSLIDRKGVGECRKALVECSTLDQEFRNIAIDSILVKLDLEGAEPLALQGMRNTLGAVRSAVVISEVNPNALRDAGMTPEELVGSLISLGFSVHFIDERNRELIPVRSSTTLRKGNLYCVKQS